MVIHTSIVLQAIWKQLYSKSSGSEKATLYQLKVLLNNASTLDPLKNLAACEDFYEIVLQGHIVAAGKLLMKKPYQRVEDLANDIVDKFVHFDPDAKVPNNDKIQMYATEVLTLGLLWLNFKDSIREGDGDRVLLCWKFLLLLFKAKNHRNYAKEAIILLSHYHCLLSERLAAQLKWSRFINVKGRRGCNISCDLHLEHLNRRLKDMITNLRSNTFDSAIHRAAKSIGVVHQVCSLFDEQSGINPGSDHHTKPLSEKDFKLVLEVLEEQKVFKDCVHRHHKSFRDIKSAFQQSPSKLMMTWLCGRIKAYKW